MFLIHTGDFHNRLGDVEAARLSAILREHPDALLLDSGDAVGAGNLGFRPAGEPILDRMRSIGYSAMALGNREAHLWRTILERKVKSAQFPVLSANLTAAAPVAGVQPWIEMERDGVRIAIVGVTPPMVTRSMWSRHLCDLLFESPRSAARSAAEALRARTDLLILLSHAGQRVDREIATDGGYDIILGGHSHTLTEAPEHISGTWICHTGSHALYAGVWSVDRAEGDWIVGGSLHPLREAA